VFSALMAEEFESTSSLRRALATISKRFDNFSCFTRLKIVSPWALFRDIPVAFKKKSFPARQRLKIKAKVSNITLTSNKNTHTRRSKFQLTGYNFARRGGDNLRNIGFDEDFFVVKHKTIFNGRNFTRKPVLVV